MTSGRPSRVLRLCSFCVLAAVVIGGCAKRQVTLPSGSSTPLADFAAIHAEMSKSCAGVRTLTAELGLSGRAGDQKLRGRALAGFKTPDQMRLEGLAPFGPPAFILAASGGNATLLLPRDDRVLRGADEGQILGALTGVTLSPADLLAILTGCVVPTPKPVSGAEHGGNWRSIQLEGGGTLYLQRSRDTWQLRAARRDGWQIEYPTWQGAWPRAVRLLSAQAPTVDLTADISQLETNTEIDGKAFAVDVPPTAQPITLEQLRQAGPLRDAESRR
jgi:outer membrane lipoprotein-sorting protein